MMARRLIFQALAVRHGLNQVKTCNRKTEMCLLPIALDNLLHRTLCISAPCFEKVQSQKFSERNNPKYYWDFDSEKATEIIENFSDEEKFRLEEVKMFYTLLEANGKLVPKEMTNEMWLRLMNCGSKVGMEKTLRVFFLKENGRKKDERLTKLKEEEKSELLKDNILKSTSFTDRIYSRFVKSPISLTKDLHLINAMMLNPPFVFDLSFANYHTFRELNELTKQLMYIHGFNRELIEPYHIHFCNIREDMVTIPALEKSFLRPIENVPITITRKSYLDLFPREKLVYLSPDSPNVYHYHPDDIPIIGGIVDLSRNDRLSLRTAKKCNIRHAKLPIDQYLSWIQGKKMLPLNHVFEILHIVAETRDWDFAFERVLPARCFKKRWV